MDIKDIIDELFEMLPEEFIKRIEEVRKKYPEVETYKANAIIKLLSENGVGSNQNTVQALRMIADSMEVKFTFDKEKKENKEPIH